MLESEQQHTPKLRILWPPNSSLDLGIFNLAPSTPNDHRASFFQDERDCPSPANGVIPCSVELRRY